MHERGVEYRSHGWSRRSAPRFHNRRPSAAEEPLNGLVDVELGDEALEDGFAGNREMPETYWVPDARPAEVWVGVARKDAGLVRWHSSHMDTRTVAVS